MEPDLCDCERLARPAGQLALGHDRDLYDYVVHHLEERMEKLKTNYYALGGFQP
jgi:hypothetical protein